jgi:hypothetical protein
MREAGAVAAFITIYQGPRGPLQHVLAAFPSNDKATAFALGLAQVYVEKEGWQQTEQGDVKSQEGKLLGKFVTVEKGDRQQRLWSNGPLLATSVGTKDDPVQFYGASRY